MGAVKQQKARKPYKCGKCAKKIEVGEDYLKICKKFSAVRYRCLKCRPRPSELTSSDKLSSIYGVQEDLQDSIATIESKEDLENVLETLESSVSVVEEVAQEYEEGADNIEEYFTETEQSAEMRERSEMLQEWQQELEDARDKAQDLLDEWDSLSKDERQERLDEVVSEVEGAVENLSI